MPNVKPMIRFLLRRPNALRSPAARWAVLALAATGAAFLVWSAVIHLELWGDGYSSISVIGPLFLAQGIGCIVLGTAIVAFRSLALLAAGAVAGAATAVGLLLTVHGGLFGYTESLAGPYAALALAGEVTPPFRLGVATGRLALGAHARTADGSRREYPQVDRFRTVGR